MLRYFIVLVSLCTVAYPADELTFVLHDKAGYKLCAWEDGSTEPHVICDLPAKVDRIYWSADGKQALVSLEDETSAKIWLYDMTSSLGNYIEMPEGIMAQDAFFGPDNNWIYYVSNSSSGGSIRRHNLRDDRDEMIMETSSGSGSTGMIAAPIWSHDRKSIYFMADSGWGEWRLYFYDPTRGEQKEVWDQPCGMPAISPRGDRLIMWIQGDDDLSLVWLGEFSIEDQGESLTQRAFFANEAPWQSTPQYRPDGKMVAYCAGPLAAEEATGSVNTQNRADPFSIKDIWLRSSSESEPVRLPGDPGLGRTNPGWRKH